LSSPAEKNGANFSCREHKLLDPRAMEINLAGKPIFVARDQHTLVFFLRQRITGETNLIQPSIRKLCLLVP
jgi:hypothetical protein